MNKETTNETTSEYLRRAYCEGFDSGLIDYYSGNSYIYGSAAYKEWERGFRSGEDNKSSED